MRKAVTLTIVFSVLAIGFLGCDLLDSSNVDNPQLTLDKATSNPQSLSRWVNGIDRQLAVALNSTVDYTSIATDNYVNTETFYNQQADALDFVSEDSDIDGMFFAQNDLRESALFGKNEVAPQDDNASPADIAELDFYLGMSQILLGEHFLNAPVEAEGEATSPSANFDRAVSALQNAIDSGDGDQTGYKLAQARAYYNNGNQSEAVSRAQEVLNEDDDYVRFQQFDGQNGPAHVMENAIYDRASLDDLQPLPRLDFLDPKYGAPSPAEDPTPFLKAEEAHLILIEADLADGNLPDAQTKMNALIDLVQARGARPVDESTEGRRRVAPEADSPAEYRPDTSAYVVRASPSDPFRSGLVLNRTASTMVPGVSGTSVTKTMVNNLSNMDEAWRMYYLMRQEIFMAEGRRFSTLGLKLPLPENEFLVNDNIDEQTAREDHIPGFIPDNPASLDAYTYEEDPGSGTFEATVQVNMNRRLANNRQDVSPFL